jgi:predicted MFS family arabinose efflux permease
VRVPSRLFRLVWGGDVDRAVRPLLAVGLTGSIAGSTLFPFIGIWAIKGLHASQAALSFAYLAGAVLGGGVGYAGGHASDRIGRRPLILVAWGLQALMPIALLLSGHDALAGLVLIAILPSLGGLGNAADQAMVADVVAPERREAAYASVRVAANLGVTIGPPLGGLLLIGGHWPHLFLGVLPLAAAALLVAARYLPRYGRYAPDMPPSRGSLGAILADRRFLLFMVASSLATMTYVATETLLPISVTTSHHLAPAAWGALMILNPLSVTLLQLRVIRWTASVPASAKLGLAMPMMGVPFLLLDWNGSPETIAVVILIFVTGEMLWVPTSQAVVAALAPADLRGAYMGAFGGTWSVGWALTPFLGLQIRSSFGDATMWGCVAALGIVAGLAGLASVRGHDAEAAVASST